MAKKTTYEGSGFITGACITSIACLVEPITDINNQRFLRHAEEVPMGLVEEHSDNGVIQKRDYVSITYGPAARDKDKVPVSKLSSDLVSTGFRIVDRSNDMATNSESHTFVVAIADLADPKPFLENRGKLWKDSTLIGKTIYIKHEKPDSDGKVVVTTLVVDGVEQMHRARLRQSREKTLESPLSEAVTNNGSEPRTPAKLKNTPSMASAPTVA